MTNWKLVVKPSCIGMVFGSRINNVFFRHEKSHNPASPALGNTFLMPVQNNSNFKKKTRN